MKNNLRNSSHLLSVPLNPISSSKETAPSMKIPNNIRLKTTTTTKMIIITISKIMQSIPASIAVKHKLARISIIKIIMKLLMANTTIGEDHQMNSKLKLLLN